MVSKLNLIDQFTYLDEIIQQYSAFFIIIFNNVPLFYEICICCRSFKMEGYKKTTGKSMEL